MHATLRRIFTWFALAAANAGVAHAAPAGVVSGTLVDAATNGPVEHAVITLRATGAGAGVQSTATDAQGRFSFEEVPAGDYKVAYGLVGGPARETDVITVVPQQPVVNLGTLRLEAGAPVKLEAVEVAARTEAFYLAIDRRTYQVGRDLQSITGSASDLLQNVPAVQVDVEGEVSLRGDSSVLILVNGKSSALMGRNRAAALQQMPADQIERVEIITNPSAKYRPDGTAGIINLVLKRREELDSAATVRASAGNDGRYNAGVTASQQRGRATFFGSVSVRQDERERFGHERRVQRGAAGGTAVFIEQHTNEISRPLSHLAEVGFDYKLAERTKLELSLQFSARESPRESVQTRVARNARGFVSFDYDRRGAGSETEKETEVTLRWQHEFPQDGRELEAELRHETEVEREDERYTQLHRTPLRHDPAERVENENRTAETELSLDYTHAFALGKLEAGYAGSREDEDLDYRASMAAVPDGRWVADAVRSNRFRYTSTIHALYGTYARPIGRLGLLGGMRLEHTTTKTDQVTAALRHRHDYTRVYPSLHSTYDLREAHQLQLSYSHRVNRPDADELNPYPDFDDPFDLRAGNPRLVPEDIHSVETGYQYRRGDSTYLATIYHRWREHGFTNVTRLLDADTLLTTPENLATSRSAGLELGATTRLRETLALNFSANAYRNEIDARNLGFDGRRTATAWDAKLNANWEASKSMLMQLTTSYTARRLTPQGERRPTHVVNFGARYTFPNRKTSLVLTVSDVFETLRDRTLIDTPLLQREISRQRGGRIVYVGFVHHFGKTGKKRGDELQFDTGL